MKYKTEETELSQIVDVSGLTRILEDDVPLVLLLLEGDQEVVKQLVPELGLIQVGGVTCSRQHLGLGGAGEQSKIISRPEYGEINTLILI